MTDQTVKPCEFAEGHCIHCGDSEPTCALAECEGWVEPEFLAAVNALKDEVEALTKERDAQAKAADYWIAEATRDHNALVTLRKERDALMADAERYRGFRAALMADDDAFIDRAANEIPDENVPITAAMVDLAFDAALAAQRSKNI